MGNPLLKNWLLCVLFVNVYWIRVPWDFRKAFHHFLCYFDTNWLRGLLSGKEVFEDWNLSCEGSLVECAANHLLSMLDLYNNVKFLLYILVRSINSLIKIFIFWQYFMVSILINLWLFSAQKYLIYEWVINKFEIKQIQSHRFNKLIIQHFCDGIIA